MDPANILKAQMGELIWTNAILSSQLDAAKKELEELKKPKEKK